MKINLTNLHRTLGALACGVGMLAGTAGVTYAQDSRGERQERHEQRQNTERHENRDERRDDRRNDGDARARREQWRAQRGDVNRQQQWQRINARRSDRDGDNNRWTRISTRNNTRFVRNGRLHYSRGRGYFRDNGRRAYRTHR
jgi:hypothetical protein